MGTKRRRQFARLAVYAVSPAELRRCIELVETLASAVLTLSTQIAVIQQQIDRLAAVPEPRSRRRAAAAAAAEGGDHEAP